MVEFDIFRQNLATSLLDCADRRRRSLAGDTPTGDDLKAIALLERLAADAENLDLHVFLLCQRLLTHERFARRFLEQRDFLFGQLGVIYVPKDASQLLRWMNQQVLHDDPVQDAGRSSPLPRFADNAPSMRSRSGESLMVSVASDFCAGFGIVAPMLAVWEVGQGLAQWHDHVLSESRPAVQASVLSATSAEGERNASMSSTIVLRFQPSPSADACQVSVQVNSATGPHQAGDSLMVVPRSPDCAPPIIASQVSDPMIAFALAAALMAGGLAALKLWGNLARRQRATPRRRADGRIWSRSSTLIGHR